MGTRKPTTVTRRGLLQGGAGVALGSVLLERMRATGAPLPSPRALHAARTLAAQAEEFAKAVPSAPISVRPPLGAMFMARG